MIWPDIHVSTCATIKPFTIIPQINKFNNLEVHESSNGYATCETDLDRFVSGLEQWGSVFAMHVH